MTNSIDVFSGMTSAVNGRKAAASKDPEAVGEQLETMFVEMMLKEMRKAMPDGGLFGGSEMGMFTEMLDREFAQRLAEGPGLGLADSLSQHLRAPASTVRAARMPLRVRQARVRRASHTMTRACVLAGRPHTLDVRATGTGRMQCRAHS